MFTWLVNFLANGEMRLNRRLMSKPNFFLKLPKYGWAMRWLTAALAVAAVTAALRIIPAVVHTARDIGWPAIEWPHFNFRNDILTMAIRLFLLEGTTLAAASIGLVYPRDVNNSQAWERQIRRGLVPYYILLTMPIIYLLSMGWSVSGFVSSSPIIFLVAFGGLFLIFPLWYPNMTRNIPYHARKNMLKNAFMVSALAFVLLIPAVPIHGSGHAEAFNLFFTAPDLKGKYPHGVNQWLSLFEGEYLPPDQPHFAPYFAAWRGVSEAAAKLWGVVCGPLASWFYAGVLLLVSRFLKRWPFLRRGIQLAALAVSFMELQYIRGSTVINFFEALQYFKDGSATPISSDWVRIWKEAPVGVKSLLTLFGFSFPYIIAVYRATADRNEWMRLRSHYGVGGFIVSGWQGWFLGIDLEKVRRSLNYVSIASVIVATVMVFTDFAFPSVPLAIFGLVTTALSAGVKAYQAIQTKGATSSASLLKSESQAS